MNINNYGLQTTDKRLYFIAENSRKRMEIQFVPDKISINRDIDLGVMKVVGRNTPRYQTIGGEELLTLNLDFCADEDSRQSVIARVEWLKSLTYTNRGKLPAQRIILVFGELYKKQKWTLKHLKAEMGSFNPQRGYYPQYANVQIGLALDTDTDIGWEDVAPLRSFGLPDGSNPVDLGKPRDNDDTKFFVATNDNSFESILRRAAERLRIFI